jgi:hypothetical protein
MTIKLSIILVFVLSMLGLKVQNDLTGKNFKALVGETCKDMTDGGCMIYTYRILNFKTDSVVVSYQVMAYCSPKERENNYSNIYDNFIKTYSWSVNSDTLTINGLDDYGKLTIQNSKLVGEDKLTKRYIEFNEEHK